MVITTASMLIEANLRNSELRKDLEEASKQIKELKEENIRLKEAFKSYHKKYDDLEENNDKLKAELDIVKYKDDCQKPWWKFW